MSSLVCLANTLTRQIRELKNTIPARKAFFIYPPSKELGMKLFTAFTINYLYLNSVS
ncbi:hypothetical protein XNW1_3230001 [Xenorhabdus nematophila str. Websteri]|nr:hypothetical protein XNW1_3230001 [Xenorhabdus nematophila str. Websteri]